MKAAPCSWRTGMNDTELDRSSASFRSSVSSPGMPNTWRTPSFSRHSTNTCAALGMTCGSVSVGLRPGAGLGAREAVHVDVVACERVAELPVADGEPPAVQAPAAVDAWRQPAHG